MRCLARPIEVAAPFCFWVATSESKHQRSTTKSSLRPTRSKTREFLLPSSLLAQTNFDGCAFSHPSDSTESPSTRFLGDSLPDDGQASCRRIHHERSRLDSELHRQSTRRTGQDGHSCSARSSQVSLFLMSKFRLPRRLVTCACPILT